MPPAISPADCNMALITLDSCRFDSLAMASTPWISSLGPVRRAHSFGLYTLPSHMSMFCGYPPNVRELPLQDYYSRERKQLWRLSRGRAKPSSSVEVLLEGATIIEGYRRRGAFTLGVGGVRWFTSPLLTSHFDRFLFWGPDDYASFFRDRRRDEFALEHHREIAEALRPHPRWFLFVNCIETHVPYDTGVEPQPDEVRRIIERAEPIWAGRLSRRFETDVTDADLGVLHARQIRACEVIDRRLERLFGDLPRPCVVYICGDHGECFGDGLKWGHGFFDEKVLEVPVVCGVLT